MAANLAASDDGPDHTGMDYPAHIATYHLFTSLIKYGATAVVLAVVLLAFFTL